MAEGARLSEADGALWTDVSWNILLSGFQRPFSDGDPRFDVLLGGNQSGQSRVDVPCIRHTEQHAEIDSSSLCDLYTLSTVSLVTLKEVLVTHEIPISTTSPLGYYAGSIYYNSNTSAAPHSIPPHLSLSFSSTADSRSLFFLIYLEPCGQKISYFCWCWLQVTFTLMQSAQKHLTDSRRERHDHDSGYDSQKEPHEDCSLL